MIFLRARGVNCYYLFAFLEFVHRVVQSGRVRGRMSVGAVIAAALVCGCDADVNVRAEWGKSIAKFGLRPLYPMRENLFLGDILLFVYNPCDPNVATRASQTMWVGSLPEEQIQTAFEAAYGARPQFPVTGSKSTASAASSSKDKPATASKISITMSSPEVQTVTATSGTSASSDNTAASRAGAPAPQNSPSASKDAPIFGTDRRFARLPMSAMPAVNLYSYIGGSAGGIFGEFMGALAGQNAKKVSINAQQVEVSELPAASFINIVNTYRRSHAYALLLQNIEHLKRSLEYEVYEAGCQVAKIQREPQLVFVNTVYYTRNLVFEFGDDSSFAAKFAVSFPAETGGGNGTFTPPTLPTASSTSNPAQSSAQGLLASFCLETPIFE